MSPDDHSTAAWDEDDNDEVDAYAPPQEDDDRSMTDLTDEGGDGDDGVTTLLFTATNPPGTVSVTSLMDGRPNHVDLGPQVAKLTERQLGDEIAIIAALSRQQARAGQHAFVARIMRDLGHDPVATRGYLEHELGLPSPETVREERASLFASRYSEDAR